MGIFKFIVGYANVHISFAYWIWGVSKIHWNAPTYRKLRRIILVISYFLGFFVYITIVFYAVVIGFLDDVYMGLRRRYYRYKYPKPLFNMDGCVRDKEHKPIDDTYVECASRTGHSADKLECSVFSFYINNKKPTKNSDERIKFSNFSYIELDKQLMMEDLVNYGSRNFSSKNIWNTSFQNEYCETLMYLSLWQHWWWFIFASLSTFYVFFLIRLIVFRRQKASPKLNTSLKSHGKWGDMIIGILPISWCINILMSSNTLMRRIDFQADTNVLFFRIKGRQWSWLYKMDIYNFHKDFAIYSKIGRNKLYNKITLERSFYELQNASKMIYEKDHFHDKDVYKNFKSFVLNRKLYKNTISKLQTQNLETVFRNKLFLKKKKAKLLYTKYKLNRVFYKKKKIPFKVRTFKKWWKKYNHSTRFFNTHQIKMNKLRIYFNSNLNNYSFYKFSIFKKFSSSLTKSILLEDCSQIKRNFFLRNKNFFRIYDFFFFSRTKWFYNKYFKNSKHRLTGPAVSPKIIYGLERSRLFVLTSDLKNNHSLSNKKKISNMKQNFETMLSLGDHTPEKKKFFLKFFSGKPSNSQNTVQKKKKNFNFFEIKNLFLTLKNASNINVKGHKNSTSVGNKAKTNLAKATINSVFTKEFLNRTTVKDVKNRKYFFGYYLYAPTTFYFFIKGNSCITFSNAYANLLRKYSLDAAYLIDSLKDSSEEFKTNPKNHQRINETIIYTKFFLKRMRVRNLSSLKESNSALDTALEIQKYKDAVSTDNKPETTTPNEGKKTKPSIWESLANAYSSYRMSGRNPMLALALRNNINGKSSNTNKREIDLDSSANTVISDKDESNLIALSDKLSLSLKKLSTIKEKNRKELLNDLIKVWSLISLDKIIENYHYERDRVVNCIPKYSYPKINLHTISTNTRYNIYNRALMSAKKFSYINEESCSSFAHFRKYKYMIRQTTAYAGYKGFTSPLKLLISRLDKRIYGKLKTPFNIFSSNIDLLEKTYSNRKGNSYKPKYVELSKTLLSFRKDNKRRLSSIYYNTLLDITKNKTKKNKTSVNTINNSDNVSLKVNKEKKKNFNIARIRQTSDKINSFFLKKNKTLKKKTHNFLKFGHELRNFFFNKRKKNSRIFYKGALLNNKKESLKHYDKGYFAIYKAVNLSKKKKTLFKYNINSLLNRQYRLSSNLNKTYLIVRDTKFRKKVKFVELMIDTHSDTVSLVENKKSLKPHWRGQYWVWKSERIPYTSAFMQTPLSLFGERNPQKWVFSFKTQSWVEESESYKPELKLTVKSYVDMSSRLLRVKNFIFLPTNVNMAVITTSTDVMHSWFIPNLGLKLDCVPGRMTHHTFYFRIPGVYYGQCAEICGRQHHHMPIKLVLVDWVHFIIYINHFMYKLWEELDKNIHYGFEKESNHDKCYDAVEPFSFNFLKTAKNKDNFIY